MLETVPPSPAAESSRPSTKNAPPRDADVSVPPYEHARTLRDHEPRTQVSPAPSDDHHKTEHCKSSRHARADYTPVRCGNDSAAVWAHILDNDQLPTSRAHTLADPWRRTPLQWTSRLSSLLRSSHDRVCTLAGHAQGPTPTLRGSRTTASSLHAHANPRHEKSLLPKDEHPAVRAKGSLYPSRNLGHKAEIAERSTAHRDDQGHYAKHVRRCHLTSTHTRYRPGTPRPRGPRTEIKHPTQREGDTAPMRIYTVYIFSVTI